MGYLGEIILDFLMNDQERHSTHMMHFCFINELASININIDSGKDKYAYNKYAYNKYTWDYINDMWLKMYDLNKKPNFTKMSMYFNL